MRFIFSQFNSPYFNIAAEEYLMANTSEDLLLVYTNESCVVIGKHQIAFAESNIDYIVKHKIPVVRRLSGGGAVYHDLGNINFSLITSNNNCYKGSNKLHNLIIAFLKKLGVDVVLNTRKDLLLKGKKISGYAQHIYKNRTLAHLTLLVETNLTHLSDALRENDFIVHSHAIKSVKSDVCNIRDYFPAINIDDLKQILFMYLLGEGIIDSISCFTSKEIKIINELAEKKYKTWDWNIAYTPNYCIYKDLAISNQLVHLKLAVSKGIIEEIAVKPEIDSLKNTINKSFQQKISFEIVAELNKI